jgi:hypothetical protein
MIFTERAWDLVKAGMAGDTVAGRRLDTILTTVVLSSRDVARELQQFLSEGSTRLHDQLGEGPLSPCRSPPLLSSTDRPACGVLAGARPPRGPRRGPTLVRSPWVADSRTESRSVTDGRHYSYLPIGPWAKSPARMRWA